MPEPIEMPFGLRTQVGSGNHVIGGVQITNGKNFETGERASHCKYYRVDPLRSSVQKLLYRSRCRLGYGLGWAPGSMY